MIGYHSNMTLKRFILNFISNLVVNMIVIFFATKIFKNIYVDGLFYTFIASVVLILLNNCVKPIIKIVMLPINIFTLGITYPFVNVFVLKILSFIMGKHFVLNGWFSAFFISIFVSIMTIIIDSLIGRSIRKV